jgi:hypothetical protein
MTSLGMSAIFAKAADNPEANEKNYESWLSKVEVARTNLEREKTGLAGCIDGQKALQAMHIKLSNEAAAIDTKNQMELIENFTAASPTDLSELSEIAYRPANFVGRALSLLVGDLMQRQSVRVAYARWQLAIAETQVLLYEGVKKAADFIVRMEPVSSDFGPSAFEPPPVIVAYEQRAANAFREEQALHQQFLNENTQLQALLSAKAQAMI